MATIYREMLLAADAERVWDAIRDTGAVHTRLARSFVTDCTLDGDLRQVTFANGLVVKERIVAVDDGLRRLAYSVMEGPPLEHHHASFQVIATGDHRCRLVWIADLLPDEAAASIRAMMEQGSLAIQRTLESKQPENSRERFPVPQVG